MSPLARAVSFWKTLRSQPFGGGAGECGALEAERRNCARFPSAWDITLQYGEGRSQETLQAKVRDISRGGIGFLVNRYLEPGALLNIFPPANEKNAVNRIPAYVVHATIGSDGRWIVGCTFARTLDDDEMQAFGAARQGAA